VETPTTSLSLPKYKNKYRRHGEGLGGREKKHIGEKGEQTTAGGVLRRNRFSQGVRGRTVHLSCWGPSARGRQAKGRGARRIDESYLC